MRHDPIDVALGPREAALGVRAPNRVADRMAQPAVTVRRDALATSAWTLMRSRKIRHLPVVDAEDRLVGIVTDRDLRALVVDSSVVDRLEDLPDTLRTTTVAQVMTPRVITVRPDADVHEAIHLMREYRIGALPVVDGGRVVGILTRTDLVRVLVEELAALRRRR